MAIDFNHPIPADTIAVALDEIRAQSAANATMFTGSTTGFSNTPTGTIRWDASAKKFTEWNGTTWVDLTDVYEIVARSVADPTIPDGTISTPGLRFTSEPSSGLYRAGALDVRLSVGGVDLLRARGADGVRFGYSGEGSQIALERGSSGPVRLLANATPSGILSSGARLNAAASAWIAEAANVGQIILNPTSVTIQGAEAQTIGANVSAFTPWLNADKTGVYAGAIGAANKLATETFVNGAYLPLAGGALTGALRINASTPFLRMQATTGGTNLKYLDMQISSNLFQLAALDDSQGTPYAKMQMALGPNGSILVTAHGTGGIVLTGQSPGGSYGSIDIKGTKGGYSGCYFPDASHYLMMSSGLCGFFTGSAWWLQVTAANIVSLGGMVVGGAYARTGGSAGSWASIDVTGSKSGYSGIRFTDVTGGCTFMVLNSGLAAGNSGWLNDAASWSLLISGGGNLTIPGNVTAYSDERLKRDLRPLEHIPLECICTLQPLRYDRTDTEQHQIGVTAQALRELLPECVNESERVLGSGEQMLSIDYGRAALILTLMLARELERRTVH